MKKPSLLENLCDTDAYKVAAVMCSTHFPRRVAVNAFLDTMGPDERFQFMSHVIERWNKDLEQEQA